MKRSMLGNGRESGVDRKELNPEKRNVLSRPRRVLEHNPSSAAGAHERASRANPNAAQNLALQTWRDERCVLTIYLANNIKQRGVLVEWDQYSIMLDIGGGVVERIHKTAILSVMPPRKERF
jgi:RNA chaperone Hfq